MRPRVSSFLVRPIRLLGSNPVAISASDIALFDFLVDCICAPGAGKHLAYVHYLLDSVAMIKFQHVWVCLTANYAWVPQEIFVHEGARSLLPALVTQDVLRGHAFSVWFGFPGIKRERCLAYTAGSAFCALVACASQAA
jgi:hypothetical protein